MTIQENSWLPDKGASAAVRVPIVNLKNVITLSCHDQMV